MRNFGGMISFDLGSFGSANAFARRLQLCALAEASAALNRSSHIRRQ
jgi:cystathionine beta-lyase/cystathionine gamma-synthase